MHTVCIALNHTHRRRNGLASGGALVLNMINIALVSMHAILYIDILGPDFVISGGAMAPLAPPVPPPMIQCMYALRCATAMIK